MVTSHLDKLTAAIQNPKCRSDLPVLRDALALYQQWVSEMESLTSIGRQRVDEMVALLNRYKDTLEVDLMMKRASAFLRRQKGQLKLDNSVLEEFIARLVRPEIIQGLGETRFKTGPQNAFMSLSFRPRGFSSLGGQPEVVVKTKDQDFVLGSEIHYKFSSHPQFEAAATTTGSFVLAVLAAEIKVNLDKTMFQEAAGTATRLKLGCPVSRYFVLVEYLDMTPEDSRLTDIDNVFLLRHTRRLPQDKRPIPEDVERQHREYPIDPEVVWMFVREIQTFVSAVWYDPDEALRRGSFA
ncbi:MAG: Bpu10I family restriction endonuclease [Armatimonadetes bacterium]|nr:Bpu10I family restriction endonuclease [Armatimonadota bacterium]